jgi:hypothetical protein
VCDDDYVILTRDEYELLIDTIDYLAGLLRIARRGQAHAARPPRAGRVARDGPAVGRLGVRPGGLMLTDDEAGDLDDERALAWAKGLLRRDVAG